MACRYFGKMSSIFPAQNLPYHMRLTTMLIAAITMPSLLFAQSTGRISGTVTDEAGKPLEGATIAVLNDASGIFINHTVSNKKGSFQVSGIPLATTVQVTVSFTGYRDTTRITTIKENNKTLATGTWKLHPGADDLDSVVVTARRPPFIVKKDTIEFDARAFKSLPADMLDDLLRRLPGMVVDQHGNVTVNGKKVTKIQVDGKDFFGGNLKTAMENLPGTVIDKVQVFDNKPRGSEYDHVVEPINENVTLNLKLKKQNKKVLFGHTGAGGGTSERYHGDIFAGVFNEGKQQSGYVNTGNSPTGHPMREDAPIPGIGQGPGILKSSLNAGLHFGNNVQRRKGGLTFAYQTENNNRSSLTQTDRINFLPDSTFLYNNTSSTESINHNHRLNADYMLNIDTLQQLSFSPNLAYNQSNAHNNNSARSLTSPDSALINTQENNTVTNDRSWQFGNRMNYNRSDRKRKTNISISWSVDLRQATGDQLNFNDNTFYKGSDVNLVSLRQQSDNKNNGISNNVSFNLSRRLGKYTRAIMNYSFMQSADNTSRDTYNYNQSTGKYDQLDSLYSVHNRNTSIMHVPSFSIGFHRGRWGAELGTGIRFIDQQNKIVWRDSTVRIVQRNISPRLMSSYRINKNSRLTVDYSVEASQPSAEQLAPVQDNTNPLYIRVGNPFLKSALTHNINTVIQAFARDYKWNVDLNGNGMITENQIVSDIYYDSVGRQIITYNNTSGNHSFNIGFNAGMRIKMNKWNMNVDLSPRLSTTRSSGFTNRQENISTTTSFSPGVNFVLSYQQYFFILVNAGIDFSNTQYSIESLEDIQYNTKRLLTAVRLVPIKRMVVNTSINYFYNSQLPEGFQRDRALVNVSLDYNLLKSEKLSVGVAVVDLLNDNVAVNRTVTPTFIENAQTNALRRYATLNLNYRFNTFGR